MTARLADHPRIVVVGASGSGKTTFSRRLAERLGRKHIELDALYWGPGWTERSDFRERVRSETTDPEWVIDGNYSVVRDELWPRATAIVWLSFPLSVVFSRVLRRTVSRLIAGDTLFAGNKESFRSAFFRRDGVIWYSVQSHAKYRREYPALLAQPALRHLERIELRSPAEAEALLVREATVPRGRAVT